MIRNIEKPALAVVLAFALAACTPVTTAPKVSTTKTTQIPRAGALTAAKASAAKALNMVSKFGGAALKVRNQVAFKSAVANPSLGRRAPAAGYRTLGVDSDTASVDASGDVQVKNPDGSVDEAIDVMATSSVSLGNGLTDVTASESILVDQSCDETGDVWIDEIDGADGKAKGGKIVYTPDASASADGALAEDITYDVPANSNIDASVSVAIDVDPTDNDPAKAQASLTEDEQPNGDIDVEGDIHLPSGDVVHMVILYHPDGTKEITCVASGFSFQVTNVTPDGVGTGTLYDRDPADPEAVKIGVITLNKGTALDTVAFYGADGTLGAEQTFKFLNS